MVSTSRLSSDVSIICEVYLQSLAEFSVHFDFSNPAINALEIFGYQLLRVDTLVNQNSPDLNSAFILLVTK